jgi:hypothetical protein
MTASAQIPMDFPPVVRLGSASDYLSSFPEIFWSRVTFFVKILLRWNVFGVRWFRIETRFVQAVSGMEVEKILEETLSRRGIIKAPSGLLVLLPS